MRLNLNTSLFFHPGYQAALLGAAFVLSFIWAPALELAMASGTLALVLVAALMVAPDAYRQSGLPTAGRAVLGILAALFVLIWLRAMWSDIPALSLLQASYYSLPIMVAFTIGSWRHNGPKQADYVLGKFVSFCAGLLAFLGLAAILQPLLFNLPISFRAQWPLNNPNHLAMIMNAGIVLATALMIAAEKNRGPAFILLILCAGGLLATGSRGGFLSAMIVLPFLLASGRKFLPSFWACLPALVTVAGLGLLFTFLRPAEVNAVAGLGEIASDFSDASGSRPEFWYAIFKLALTHPWIGFGTGTFPVVYPQVMVPTHLTGGYAAHNDTLQLFLELGILGPLSYLALGLAVVMGTRRALAVPMVNVQTARLLGAAGILGVVVIHAQIEFALGVLPLMMLMGLALGAWMLALPDTAPVPPGTVKTTSLTVKIPQAVFMVGVVISMAQMNAEAALRRADTALRHNDLATFAADVDRAKIWSLSLHAYPYLRAANFHLTMLVVGNLTGRSDPETIENLLNQALHKNPYLSAAWEARGRLLQFNGDDPVKAWETGLALEPRNAGLRLLLAQEYDRRGQGNQAEKLLAAAVAWPALRGNVEALYDYAEGYFRHAHRADLLAQLTQRQKDRQFAQERRRRPYQYRPFWTAIAD